MRRRLADLACALVAVAAIGCALSHLGHAGDGTVVSTTRVGTTPATVYHPAQGGAHPVVVIAHGFAGSQQLMQSYALTLARNGYIAVTFDFPGHGRNPTPPTGSITDENGATRTLLDSLARVATYAGTLGDGHLALLGHSMASDIVVRYAEQHPEIDATVAVSMYSRVVTASQPRDLLIVVGDWETLLKAEALRAVGLASAPEPPRAFATYGDPAQGTGRRAAFSAHVEHASVLYSQQSEREIVAWLDAVYGTHRSGAPVLDDRGPWILALLAGGVLLARPLARLLPRVCAQPLGAGLSWRGLRLPVVVPMLVTPLLLRVLPTHFLPVLVGDYLACHFLVYGLATFACLRLCRPTAATPWRLPPPRVVPAALLVLAYSLASIVWPVDRYVTSFVPGAVRLPLIGAMLVGTLAYFLADEWLTRGPGAARGAYAVSKAAFLASLAIAVALDFQRLFFLVIIIPVVLLFFVVYGLYSAWAYRQTGHPWPAALANAVAFAWAIGVTFPLLAG